MKVRTWYAAGLLILVLVHLNARGQSTGPKSNAPKKAPSKASAAKPKLTDEQQRGLDMLKAANAKAGALNLAMRAAVMWQAAHGYAKVDHDQLRVKLKDAFRAAASAEDEHADVHCFFQPDSCHAKPWMEQQILLEMVSQWPMDVENLLPQAEPEVRRAVTGHLISKYVKDKKLDHARELLGRVREEKDFPYDAAVELMLAMPKDQRQSIFDEALSNYRDVGQSEDLLIQPEDLGTLTIRFWQELSPPTVTEAVDLLLKVAKQKTEQTDENQVTFGTSKGSVALSAYEYRLFELLPVLQELDPPRAKSLLDEHAAVSGALQAHPAGLASLDPRYRDTPLTQEEDQYDDFPSISFGGKAGESAAEVAFDQQWHQLEQKAQLAREQAKTDPKTALETALTIPQGGSTGPGSYSPREAVLADVAVMVAAKDSSTAERALDEIRKNLDHMNLLQSGRIVIRMISAYQKMNDNERANKAIDDAMKIASKIYEKDNNADHPNLALKAEWPSAALWGKLVTLGMKISTQRGQELLSEIRDDEIRTLEEVAVANGLLGAPRDIFQAIEWHEDGSGTMWAF